MLVTGQKSNLPLNWTLHLATVHEAMQAQITRVPRSMSAKQVGSIAFHHGVIYSGESSLVYGASRESVIYSDWMKRGGLPVRRLHLTDRH